MKNRIGEQRPSFPPSASYMMHTMHMQIFAVDVCVCAVFFGSRRLAVFPALTASRSVRGEAAKNLDNVWLISPGRWHTSNNCQIMMRAEKTRRRRRLLSVMRRKGNPGSHSFCGEDEEEEAFFQVGLWRLWRQQAKEASSYSFLCQSLSWGRKLPKSPTWDARMMYRKSCGEPESQGNEKNKGKSLTFN